MTKSVFGFQPPFRGRIPDDAVCIRCGRTAECRHHVFAGPDRWVSEREGLWVYMCDWCHNRGPWSIHSKQRSRRFRCTDDEHLRWAAQQAWETRYIHETGATDEEAREAWRVLAKGGMKSYEYVANDYHADWCAVWGRGIRRRRTSTSSASS